MTTQSIEGAMPPLPERMDRQKRKARIEGDLAYIPLTRGLEAIIDAADLHLIEGRNWHVNNGYAIRKQRVNGKETTFHMHRVIANTPEGMETDHINRNRLDNRRKNLRAVTTKENQANAGIRKDNKTGFKGVTWHINNNRWIASIRNDGKSFHLGSFKDINDANAAYKKAAEETRPYVRQVDAALAAHKEQP